MGKNSTSDNFANKNYLKLGLNLNSDRNIGSNSGNNKFNTSFSGAKNNFNKTSYQYTKT